MLSGPVMLIRFEQIVWQKGHNVLNPVWHLKRIEYNNPSSQSICLSPKCGISVFLSHLPNSSRSEMKTVGAESSVWKAADDIELIRNSFSGSECVTLLFKRFLSPRI